MQSASYQSVMPLHVVQSGTPHDAAQNVPRMPLFSISNELLITMNRLPDFVQLNTKNIFRNSK